MAAIRAMGNPVALEARAEERLTRGFISMITIRPVSGWTANCTFEPPVSHADLAHDGEGGVPHHLVFLVGQGLLGRHGDRIPRVDTQGVQVLDGADHDALVGAVPHHLHLEFLPPHQGFLDEDLGDHAPREAPAEPLLEFLTVEHHRAAHAAQGEGGADDGGQAGLFQDLETILDGAGEAAHGYVQADAAHRVVEELPLLRRPDGPDAGPDEAHVVALEDAFLLGLHRQVQGGLASHGGEQGVGLLPGDDPLQDIHFEGFHVGGVGQGGVGHDRGRVAVHQDHPQALFPQGLHRLGAGIVELAGLADHDGPAADDQYALQVLPSGHEATPSRCFSGHLPRQARRMLRMKRSK